MPLKKTGGDITAEELNNFINAYNKLIEITGDEIPDASPEEQIYNAILKFRDLLIPKLILGNQTPDKLVYEAYEDNPKIIMSAIPYDLNANAKIVINGNEYPIYKDGSPLEGGVLKEGEVVFFRYDTGFDRYVLLNNASGAKIENGLKVIKTIKASNVNFRRDYDDAVTRYDYNLNIDGEGNSILIEKNNNYNGRKEVTIFVYGEKNDIPFITILELFKDSTYINDVYTSLNKLILEYDSNSNFIRFKDCNLKYAVVTDVFTNGEDNGHPMIGKLDSDANIKFGIGNNDNPAVYMREVYSYDKILNQDKNTITDFITPPSKYGLRDLPILSKISHSVINDNVESDSDVYVRSFKGKAGNYLLGFAKDNVYIKNPDDDTPWNAVLQFKSTNDIKNDIINTLRGGQEDNNVEYYESGYSKLNARINEIANNFLPLNGPGDATETDNEILVPEPTGDYSAIPKKWSDDNLVSLSDSSSDNFRSGYATDNKKNAVTSDDLLLNTDKFYNNGLKYNVLDNGYNSIGSITISDSNVQIDVADIANDSKLFSDDITDKPLVNINNAAYILTNSSTNVLKVKKIAATNKALYILYTNGLVLAKSKTENPMVKYKDNTYQSVASSWYKIYDNADNIRVNPFGDGYVIREGKKLLFRAKVAGTSYDSTANGEIITIPDDEAIGEYGVSNKIAYYSTSIKTSGDNAHLKTFHTMSVRNGHDTFSDGDAHRKTDTDRINDNTLRLIDINLAGLLILKGNLNIDSDVKINAIINQHDGAKKAFFAEDDHTILILCNDGCVFLYTSKDFDPVLGDYGKVMLISRNVKDIAFTNTSPEDGRKILNIYMLEFEGALKTISIETTYYIKKVFDAILIRNGVKQITSNSSAIYYLTEDMCIYKYGGDDGIFDATNYSSTRLLYPMSDSYEFNIGKYVGNFLPSKIYRVNPIDGTMITEHNLKNNISALSSGFKLFTNTGKYYLLENMTDIAKDDNKLYLYDVFDSNNSKELSVEVIRELYTDGIKDAVIGEYILTKSRSLLVTNNTLLYDTSTNADYYAPNTPDRDLKGKAVNAYAYFEDADGHAVAFWVTDNKLYGKGRNFGKILNPSGNADDDVDTTVILEADVLSVNSMHILAGYYHSDYVLHLVLDIEKYGDNSLDGNHIAGLLLIGNNSSEMPDIGNGMRSIYDTSGVVTGTFYSTPRVRRIYPIDYKNKSGNKERMLLAETTSGNFYLIPPTTIYSKTSGYDLVTTDLFQDITAMSDKLEDVKLRSFEGYRWIDNTPNVALYFISEDEKSIEVLFDTSALSNFNVILGFGSVTIREPLPSKIGSYNISLDGSGFGYKW